MLPLLVASRQLENENQTSALEITGAMKIQNITSEYRASPVGGYSLSFLSVGWHVCVLSSMITGLFSPLHPVLSVCPSVSCCLAQKALSGVLPKLIISSSSSLWPVAILGEVPSFKSQDLHPYCMDL